MKRAAVLRFGGAAWLAVGLGGCLHLPAARPPEPAVAVPEEFAASVPSASAPSVDGARGWWTGFGSPGLDAAIAAALADNPEVDAIAARIEAAAAQARVAGAELWPQASAGVDASRRRQSFLGFPIPGAEDRVLTTTTTTLSAMLNVSWEVDLWGRVRAARRAATASHRASSANGAAAYLSLTGQTAKAWLAWREAGAQAGLADELVENRAAALAGIERRFSAGLAPAATLRRSRAELASVRATAEARHRAAGAARRVLQALMGSYPDGAWRADLEPLPELSKAPAPGAPADLLLGRPDLVALGHRLEAAGYRIHEARAARLPALRLSGSVGRTGLEAEDLTADDFTIWSLAAGLLQPVVQGGRLAGAEDLAEARHREAQAVWSGAFLRAATEVESALAADHELARGISALEEAVSEGEAAADLAARRHLQGIGDYLERLEAERSLAAARVELLAARRARLENRVDLHLALGGGYRPDGLVSPSFAEKDSR